MALRTVQLLGKAWSDDGSPVTLSCLVNGQETHNLPVPTHVGPMPPFDIDNPLETEVLMTFGIDHEEFIAGILPVQIIPTGGDVAFAGFRISHFGFEVDATTDYDTHLVFTQDPANTFGPLNFNTFDSDGTETVLLDGVPAPDVRPDVVSTEAEAGDWIYRIPDGSTWTCDYTVELIPFEQLQVFSGITDLAEFTLTPPLAGVNWASVDGVPQWDNWTYNDTTNVITFDVAPANGSTIQILTSTIPETFDEVV